MFRVLAVDDEVNILAALRRSLASIDATRLDGDALYVETFTSPEAALERSETLEFDLVLTDYRMPTMDGVEFLLRFLEIQPNVPRAIISGYADREAIIAAINQAQLTRFIEKPWDDDDLHRSVVAILVGTSLATRPPPPAESRLGPTLHLYDEGSEIASLWANSDDEIRLSDFDV